MAAGALQHTNKMHFNATVLPPRQKRLLRVVPKSSKPEPAYGTRLHDRGTVHYLVPSFFAQEKSDWRGSLRSTRSTRPTRSTTAIDKLDKLDQSDQLDQLDQFLHSRIPSVQKRPFRLEFVSTGCFSGPFLLSVESILYFLCSFWRCLV